MKSLFACLGMLAVAGQPTVAAETGAMPPLPPAYQFGVCSLMAGLVFHQQRSAAKGMRALAASHEKGDAAIATSIDKLEQRLATNQESELSFLRDLATQKGGNGPHA